LRSQAVCQQTEQCADKLPIATPENESQNTQ